ncbi:MAG: hypothetical protein ACRDTZ_00150 [Pseudonocardiaceae bacterium]
MTDPTSTPTPTPSPVRNGYGITALALAIPGLVFGLVPLTGFLALILGALAALFGLLGWGRVKRHEATNRAMTVTGTTLGALAVILGIWGISVTAGAVDQFGRDLRDIGAHTAPLTGAAQPASDYTPTPQTPPALSDFTIGIKVIEKQCFGSAGCHITYRIEPVYLGDPTRLTGQYTVVYEVTGSEYGPQVNNFTVDSVGFRHQESEFTSTSSSKAELTAEAVSVF